MRRRGNRPASMPPMPLALHRQRERLNARLAEHRHGRQATNKSNPNEAAGNVAVCELTETLEKETTMTRTAKPTYQQLESENAELEKRLTLANARIAALIAQQTPQPWGGLPGLPPTRLGNAPAGIQRMARGMKLPTATTY